MAKQLSASVKSFVPVKHIKAFVPAIARASSVPPPLNPSASTFVPNYLDYHHKTICDKNFDELAASNAEVERLRGEFKKYAPYMFDEDEDLPNPPKQ